MTTLADAHTQWHSIYGKYAVCDLDCGAGEIVSETFQYDHEARLELTASTGHLGIRCAHCKGRHISVAVVKFCREVTLDAEQRERADSNL